MLGSILGYAALFAGDSPPSRPQFPPSDGTVDDGTLVNFVSENPVKAVVFQLNPVLFVSAKTREPELNKIDEILYSVVGVIRLNSRYAEITGPTIGSSLTYISEIRFDDSREAEELVSEIESASSGVLENFEVYRLAFTTVKGEISFVNPDLNFSLNKELEDPLVETVVYPDTTAGEEIEVQLNAYFAGKTLQGIDAYEYRDTSIRSLSFTESFSIESLKGSLVAGAREISFSEFISFDELEQKLLELEAVSGAEVTGSVPPDSFTLGISFSPSETFEEDLNALLSASPEISSFELFSSGEGFSAEVKFSEKEDFSSIKEFLSAEIPRLGLGEGDFSFTESTGSYSADLNFSGSSIQTAERVEGLFSLLSFPEPEIFQAGIVLLETIFDGQTGKELPLEDREVEVLLFPGHSVGEEVELEFTAFVQAGKILFVSASESESA